MSSAIPAATTEVAGPLEAAASASAAMAAMPPAERAGAMDAAAEALDAAAAELVPLAARETHLAIPRLEGELKRTTFQLRLLATTIRTGTHLGVVIDAADDGWATGPRRDMRRMLIPVGPVVVFAASNFPFAFSVAGGDTAAAIAAGCPVVVKAHPGHPLLSQRVFDIMHAALIGAGLPDGALSIVFGVENGRQLVLDDRVEAVAFTGSTGGGRALFDLATSRPRPIPFYGELGSTNPVFVTEAAVAERGDEIWSQFADSNSLGAGQFCTKPGIMFVPESSEAADKIAGHLAAKGSFTLLNEHIAGGFDRVLSGLEANPGVRVVLPGSRAGDEASPTLLATDLASFTADESLHEECFGPAGLVVSYPQGTDLAEVATQFTGELTASVHGTVGDASVAPLVTALQARAGRVLWNDWPTGVSVTHAMEHGGPYPASTSSRDTSVGTATIGRFLRPVAFQNFPAARLPPALQDANPWAVEQKRP